MSTKTNLLEDGLEAWSYMKMCMSSHDANGKIILNEKSKTRKKKCPLGKKVVAHPFFRSIVYHVDHLLETAKEIYEFRRRDLEEFDYYVKDRQTDEDEDYRQELANEIVYWIKMIDLYENIKEHKALWVKQGKFPWSGVKVSTPYYDAPPIRMDSSAKAEATDDIEMDSVDAGSGQLNEIKLRSVSKDGSNSKARRSSRNRKRNGRSKRSRV